MDIKIDWSAELRQHSFEKNLQSLMNPTIGAKVTWPQYICEMIFYNRSQVMNSYSDVKRGPDWFRTIQKEVRSLNQQACALTGYFPNPFTEEPLVLVAFKNFIRKHRTLKFGTYRKTRVTKKGICNISQDEKDFIIGVSTELERLIQQRNSFKEIGNKIAEKTILEQKTFAKGEATTAKNSLANLLKIEKELNNG